MTITTININNTSLSIDDLKLPFVVSSFPRPYNVSAIRTCQQYEELTANADFIIIDKNISKLYKLSTSASTTIYEIEAIERNKTMTTVLSIVDAFIDGNISKGSRVVAVGGGIIQDLAACACSLFRRGQPFDYLPTTTLGQLDSCVGGKCAINTNKAKNIIGLFSAPSNVVIPSFMVQTLPVVDHLAGLSEMLRLCITSSREAVFGYRSFLPHILYPNKLDLSVYDEALSLSLSIKKSIVEFDEYEKDIRRSMNYGHTFGHSIEKLVEYRIPHGIAVLVGMHMANCYSAKLGLLSPNDYNLMTDAIKETLAPLSLEPSILASLSVNSIIDQFKYDKKGNGISVPLILVSKPGHILFKDHTLNDNSPLLTESISTALEEVKSFTA